MKKLILLTLMVFGSHYASADVINVPTFSADSTVSHLNEFRTKVVNAINGQISGAAGTGSSINILADSVDETDMADSANPRIRDAELVGLGVDSMASGSLVQASFVSSGCTPADSANLTSDISACVAYISGYRVTKAATSRTYTASKDTYVDLSINGTYTFSEVTVGATAPAVASNSARLAFVTTNGTEITVVTDLANRRLPGLLVPANFRSGFLITRDTTVAMTLGPGTIEVNNTMVTKSGVTQLDISAAGSWAGGASLQAVSTHGYVGVDDDGNVKLHTTAPSHSNYAVSSTVGTKRYATWSSVVYRIIAWFYMNATGSGQLDTTWGVSNFAADGVPSTGMRHDATADTINDTAYGTDLSNTTLNVYSSGGPFRMTFKGTNVTTVGDTNNGLCTVMSVDATGLNAWVGCAGDMGTEPASVHNANLIDLPQGTHTILFRAKVTGGSDVVNQKSTDYQEL